MKSSVVEFMHYTLPDVPAPMKVSPDVKSLLPAPAPSAAPQDMFLLVSSTVTASRSIPNYRYASIRMVNMTSTSHLF